MFVLFMFSSAAVSACLVFHLVLMHAVISTLGVVLIVTPTDWCTIPTGQSLELTLMIFCMCGILMWLHFLRVWVEYTRLITDVEAAC